MRAVPILLPLVAGCALVRVDPEAEAEQAAIRAEAAAHLDAARAPMEAAQKALQAHPWMADRACTRDASLVLHPLFGFDDSLYIDQGLPRPTWTDAEHEALRSAIEAARAVPGGQHWMTQGHLPEVQAISLPWVPALRGFDCWNLTAHNPWQQVPPEDFVGRLMPTPSGVPLMLASELLLLQLASPAADHDEAWVHQTLEDVRGMAQLCIRSQEMVLMAAGASILQKEREAVAWLAQQGRLPADWQAVPRVDIELLQSLARVSPAIANLYTPPAHRDLVGSPAFAVGRCAGIREGVRTALGFQGLLYEEQLQWLGSVLDRSAEHGCHLDDLRALWSEPALHWGSHPPFDNPLMPPAMRTTNALVLANVGVVTYTWDLEVE